MLCNLAAAEIVMPLGSLPPSESLPKIEQLMIDRWKFDVSAEAFLMRVVKTTSEPVLMFCASPVESRRERLYYRINYSIGSKSAPSALSTGTSIPLESAVNTCTAIGQTVHATESRALPQRSILLLTSNSRAGLLQAQKRNGSGRFISLL
jgi:hypothetical protein